MTISQSAPALFDELEDLELGNAEGQIFNGKTFYKPFVKDLVSAKRSVVISSPRLYNVSRNGLVSHLHEICANGIEVIILTKTDNEQTDYLKSQGLTIRVIPSLNLCSTIIDKSIVWYGSVNALGFASEEDNVIRLEDDKIAGELLGELMPPVLPMRAFLSYK